jgi:TIR domain
MTEYALLSKIIPALRRLRSHYERKEEVTLRDLIDASSVHIEPNTEFDNWNGGTFGHDVHLFVSDEMMGLIDLDKQAEIFDRVCQDLNKATPDIENEYVRAVHFSPFDSGDPQSQAAIPFTREPRARPEDVGLWRENCLRLFISHRDSKKAIAHHLANCLEPYGVCSFVAHDAIKPMKKWQEEILNGLMTMEVMLVLLTDDFHDSEWTNQEVGFALGKGIPVITVKVGKSDPKGFLGNKQAMRGELSDMTVCATEVHRLLVNEIGQEGRLKAILIEAFISSPNYPEAIERLERLVQTTDRLTDKELKRISDGYRKNSQLYGCGGIHNRGNWFKRYLEDSTGKSLEIKNREIIEVINSDEEIPF